MGTITIRFIGLCIHIEQSVATKLPRQHRVVLLANPAVTLRGHELAAHVPKLKLSRPMEIQVPGFTQIGPALYQMQGVTLSVDRAAEQGVSVAPDNWGSVPHLTPPGGHLELNEGVAYAMVPPAAVYFDVSGGRFSACHATENGAIGTTLVITTEDGPPVLELASFHPVAKQSLEFQDGDLLVITNVADDRDGELPRHDDKFDFLLNYGIATEIPSDPPMPQKIERTNFPACIDPDVNDDLGPSCSNSNFP